MRKRIVILLFILTFLPMVSAGILISQPERFYSIGDELSVDVTLSRNVPANDFLTVDIACGNESVNIYRSPFNLQTGEQVTINVIALLSKSLIGNLMGESCQLLTDYANDNAASQSFEISNKINIKLELEGNRYGPGDSIYIGGTALKKSGILVNGIVEAKIDSLGITTSNIVDKGKFSFNFTLPKDSPAGEHIAKIKIYEEDNLGKISNEGNISELIEIYQVLSSLEILVSSQNIIPGEEFSYTVNAYDQAEALIDEEISLSVYEPGGFVFLNKLIGSGDELHIQTEPDFIPGYWKIEVSTGDLTSRKLFYIEEVEKIQTSLINDTLIVTNIGNVPYKGPIEISIGTSIQIRQLNLDVGETKRFKLQAPDGTYSISVDDGTEDINFGNVFLTGNAIAIKDVRDGFIGTVSTPWVWPIAIIILILIIVYVHIMKSRLKKKTTEKSPMSKALGAAGKKIKTAGSAQSTESVMYGAKEDASVIALKSEGKANSPYVKAAIEKAHRIAKHSGGKVYVDGNYYIILFSPTLTKVKENELISIKVAKRIEELLKEHNRKFKDKINFGLGINTGQIISEKKHDQFRFTSVGTVISKAKRIAQSTQSFNGEALLSDPIRRAVVNEVKTEKVKDKEVWRIIKISDRTKHEDFLHRFIHRK